jgi:hypothetical protein
VPTIRKRGKPSPRRKARGLTRREVVSADVKLAKAVLRGELIECAWDALKFIHFGVETDKQCAAALKRWAAKHGIHYEERPVKIVAAGVLIRTKRVYLKPKA